MSGREIYAGNKDVEEGIKAKAGTIVNIAGTAGANDDGAARTKLHELIDKLGKAGIIVVT